MHVWSAVRRWHTDQKAMESHVYEFRFARTPQQDVFKRSHPCTVHGKRIDEYADVYNASCRCGSSMHCSDSAFSFFASEPCKSSSRVALHSHHAAPSCRRTQGSTEGRIQGPASGPRTTGGTPTSGPRATEGGGPRVRSRVREWVTTHARTLAQDTCRHQRTSRPRLAPRRRRWLKHSRVCRYLEDDALFG